jgi:antirestriction protein ArdC
LEGLKPLFFRFGGRLLKLGGHIRGVKAESKPMSMLPFNRDLNNRFGTKAYAAEELVAELGAAILCAQLGVTGQLHHAEYIGNWLELLKKDEGAIFTASSKASH